jgi:glycosyltransferase involved in cell wall biosynthesis
MNAARTLGSLLDDLLAFEMPAGWDKEIIVSYSKSHDDTLAVSESRSVKIVHGTTIGPGAARNVAAENANGEIFYFIDADAKPAGSDFFKCLISSLESLERDANFGGFGGPILLSPSQRMNPIAQADHFACWFNWNGLRKSHKTNLFQPTVSFVIPRSVFECLNGFDASIRVLEDFDLHKRGVENGYSFYFVQDFVVTHHARDTILKSWRHSWYWGAPFRSAYLEKTDEVAFRIPPHSKWFWINLPGIFLRRMRLVLRAARKVSPMWTLLSLPFISITIFSWALASVVGRDQPPPETPVAI